MSHVDAGRPTLYLVRHGETDWNAEGRFQGGKDIPLNDFGRVQAEEAGAKLRALVPRFDDLDYVSSPMTRARETMEILRRSLDLHAGTYRIDDRLRELTFGEWEGFTWAEIVARDGEKARARDADKWGYQPPSGESYAMLAERVRPWFEDLRRDTLAVAHGGVARALLALTGAIDEGEAANVNIWQGKVLVLAGGKADWV